MYGAVEAARRAGLAADMAAAAAAAVKAAAGRGRLSSEGCRELLRRYPRDISVCMGTHRNLIVSACLLPCSGCSLMAAASRCGAAPAACSSAGVRAHALLSSRPRPPFTLSTFRPWAFLARLEFAEWKSK